MAAAKEEERRQKESIKLGGVAEQVRPLELASTRVAQQQSPSSFATPHNLLSLALSRVSLSTVYKGVWSVHSPSRADRSLEGVGA